MLKITGEMPPEVAERVEVGLSALRSDIATMLASQRKIAGRGMDSAQGQAAAVMIQRLSLALDALLGK